MREKHREDQKLLAQQQAARDEQMMDRHRLHLQHAALQEQQVKHVVHQVGIIYATQM